MIVNTENGQLTILPEHIPVITMTNEGIITWYNQNTKRNVELERGILKVDRNEVIILANFK